MGAPLKCFVAPATALRRSLIGCRVRAVFAEDLSQRICYVVSDFLVILEEKRQVVGFWRNFGCRNGRRDRKRLRSGFRIYPVRHCVQKHLASFAPHTCERQHSFSRYEFVSVIHELPQLRDRRTGALFQQSEGPWTEG